MLVMNIENTIFREILSLFSNTEEKKETLQLISANATVKKPDEVENLIRPINERAISDKEAHCSSESTRC